MPSARWGRVPSPDCQEHAKSNAGRIRATGRVIWRPVGGHCVGPCAGTCSALLIPLPALIEFSGSPPSMCPGGGLGGAGQLVSGSACAAG